jgi:hypothetical protein
MRVCFALSTGSWCCINEHGSTVIDGQAGCLLNEEEFAVTPEFEALSVFSKKSSILTREQLSALMQEDAETRRRPALTVKPVSLLQSLQ